METEKTLLQQIREKEQEYARHLASVRAEADAAVTAARSEAEAVLSTAETTGRTEAEQYYQKEKNAIDAGVLALKQKAEGDREAAKASGERNLTRAADAITRMVTRE